MTTIAYRDGVLAADTQITSGNNARCGDVIKIGECPDGAWWGYSGDTQQQEAFAEWASGSRDAQPAKWDGAGVGILCTADTRVREWWGGGWIEVTSPYHAWGSGERIARGAMAAGADAERAVSIAIEIDPETGGSVTVLRRA